MSGHKIIINHLLWRIGFRDVLPGAVVNCKRIEECGEPLKKYKGVSLRQGVIERLKLAESKLPSGISIKILSGFRPLSEQKKLWNAEIKKLKKQFPAAGADELKRRARARVADPEGGGGGHQTGGAIDVTLVDARGRELDMGGGYLKFDVRTPTKAINNSNRKILRRAMIAAGFINYPREWWHYSYGDKIWAAYGRKSHAIYGTV